jgi:hypothetical protein
LTSTPTVSPCAPVGCSGILALDKNDNGTIDNVGEMFGGPGRNDFAALAGYDLNSDGAIGASNAVFSELRCGWMPAAMPSLTRTSSRAW